MKKTSLRLMQLSIFLMVISVFPSFAVADTNSESGDLAKSTDSSDQKHGTNNKEKDATSSESEDSKKKDSAFSVSARIHTTIGQGTFVQLQRAKNEDSLRKPSSNTESESSDVTLGFAVGLGYKFKKHSLSASLGGTQYLTGGSNSHRDFTIGNLTAQYNWAGFDFDSIHSNLSFGGALSLPTSLEARAAHLFFNLGASASWSTTFFDSLELSFNTDVSKSFNEYTGPVASQQMDDLGNSAIVFRPTEQIGPDIALGGLYTEWVLGLGGGISWSFWQMGLSVGYSFIQRWSYENHDPTRFVPQGKDINGNIIADVGNRRYSQAVQGTIALSYTPDVEWLKGVGFSLMAITYQSPRTPDNSSYNFPFWNFRSAAEGVSALRFAVSYRYAYPF